MGKATMIIVLRLSVRLSIVARGGYASETGCSPWRLPAYVMSNVLAQGHFGQVADLVLCRFCVGK
jgi:hypothetical protein